MSRNPGMNVKSRNSKSPYDPYAEYDSYEKGEFEAFDMFMNKNKYEGPPRGTITAVFSFPVKDNLLPTTRDKWLGCISLAKSGQFAIYWPPHDEIPTTSNELVMVEVDRRVATGQRRRVAVDTVIRKLDHYANSETQRQRSADQESRDRWSDDIHAAILSTGFRPCQDPGSPPRGFDRGREPRSPIASPTTARVPLSNSSATRPVGSHRGAPDSHRPGSSGSTPRPIPPGRQSRSHASRPGSRGSPMPGSPTTGSSRLYKPLCASPDSDSDIFPLSR